MKKSVYILGGVFLLFFGCSDTSNNNSYSPPVYNEILTVNLPDSFTLTLYSADTDSLTYAYNNVHFKVWKNSATQNGGYLKVYPKMRMTPHITHSTPVSDSFAYNSSTGFFSGYIILNMQVVPPDLVWKTKFTYVDQNGISHEADSIPLYTSYRQERQLKLFYDLSDSANYTLTLVKPFNPSKGLNDMVLLLHGSTDLNLQFEQIRDAQMYINVYKQDSLYSTNSNINPSIDADGYYKGKINIPHRGSWIVGDTIMYNGRVITNNPPPLPEFNFEIR